MVGHCVRNAETLGSTPSGSTTNPFLERKVLVNSKNIKIILHPIFFLDPRTFFLKEKGAGLIDQR